MKKVILLLALCPLISLAQSIEALKKYREFQDSIINKYEDFRAKANEKYAQFIKSVWQQYEVMPAIVRPKDESKPPIVIDDEQNQTVPEDNEVPIEEVIVPPTPSPSPMPPSPVKEDPLPFITNFGFKSFGTDLSVRIPTTFSFELNSVSNDDLAKGWNDLSASGLDNTLIDCLKVRKANGLCDWAYLCMLSDLSDALSPDNKDAATLIKAYLFCQSGYKMRLARNNNHLSMLYGTPHIIYNQRYINIDGTIYNVEGEIGSSLDICPAKFPNEQEMSLYIENVPLLAENKTAERTILSDKYAEYPITVQSNKNLIDFFNSYPTSYVGDSFMTRWQMYAQTPLSSSVKESLYPALNSMITEKDRYSAVNTLCNWIQLSFKYELDDKVWGCDRAFFADETLFYSYCDCEDRSILFTRIVRDLLGLDCLLVYYPGHLATAVALGEEAPGDFIRLDGKKYLICDPTYIGASIGRTMPGMDNTSAKVIRVN